MAAPQVKKFPDDALEKKIYNLVDKYSEYILIANDRNRFAFSLFKYVKGEGDEPAVLVKSTKIQLTGISPEELAGKIKADLEKL